MNPESQVRRGLLARTLFETLRDAGEPLAPKDALTIVTSRVSPNQQELSHNASGFPRYETYLRWVSTWGSAIGWMAKRGGWSITEAGVEAIAEFPGDEFVSELTRRYRLHRKQTQQKAVRLRAPRLGGSGQDVGLCGGRMVDDLRRSRGAHRALRAIGREVPGGREGQQRSSGLALQWHHLA
jgi:hypothetical protein